MPTGVYPRKKKAGLERKKRFNGPDARLLYFMGHVEMVTESGCWIWTGAISPGGYGRVGWLVSSKPKKSITKQAHRVAHELFKGPIPNGLHIDHLCRVRCCVNPWHLEAVTKKENDLRGFSPAANHARKTHCVRGHELSGGNIYPSAEKRKAGRVCRMCHRLNNGLSRKRCLAKKGQAQ